MHRRPDAAARLRSSGRPGRLFLGRQGFAELAHVLHGYPDGELEHLARTGIDDRNLAGFPCPARTDPTQKAGRRLDGTLRRRQADPLGRARSQLLQPLQAESEMGAALGTRQSVDLIDDDVLHAA